MSFHVMRITGIRGSCHTNAACMMCKVTVRNRHRFYIFHITEMDYDGFDKYEPEYGRASMMLLPT